mmetsp:Transcript_38366/g.93175  ORF Transcript_38366/g.93175 Transcript_38366/m.93175 type:complete len:103 (-) Transcript_38366:35-343(-)
MIQYICRCLSQNKIRDSTYPNAAISGIATLDHRTTKYCTVQSIDMNLDGTGTKMQQQPLRTGNFIQSFVILNTRNPRIRSQALPSPLGTLFDADQSVKPFRP